MTEKKVTNYPYSFNGKNYRCVGDDIIIRVLKPKLRPLVTAEWTTLSEKDLYDAALEHPYQGEVIAVGDGKVSGVVGMEAPKVNVGDIVFYNRVGNTILKFQVDTGKEIEYFLVIRESNCILIQQKEK